LGDGEREAIRRFAELAAEMKIIPQDTMVRFYDCEIVG
jgi:hypothetical protein